TAGPVSYYKGADKLLPDLPKARYLISDSGYDSGRFRLELILRGITPCIPSRCSRRRPIPHNAVLYVNVSR
ncbi:MAG TPA: IS5/IS1182 family transposase, partial [Acetobacteraceae bacterium]|nr:IS5/IS1182 family transposase [Acetobacteraceae bacterium]